MKEDGSNKKIEQVIKSLNLEKIGDTRDFLSKLEEDEETTLLKYIDISSCMKHTPTKKSSLSIEDIWLLM